MSSWGSNRLVAGRASLRGLVGALRRHPIVLAALVLTAGVVVVRGFDRGRGAKAIAYLVAMLICVIATDIITARRGAGEPVPVRSARRESVFVVAGTLVGATALWLHKVSPELEASHSALRIVLAALIFGFVFPVVPMIYLRTCGYRLRDLGFDRRGLRDAVWMVPPLMLVTAAAALLTHPEAVTLMRGLDQFGSLVPLLIATFIGAALPEELFRFLVQSRLGRVFNPASGWFIASVAWAFIHLPAWYAEGGDLLGSAFGCVRIVPLGLMWGYVTYRTGNIWSVWLLHGANLWGLQNF